MRITSLTLRFERRTSTLNSLTPVARLAEVYFQSVEVGVRGFVAHSFVACLRLLGVSGATVKRAKSSVSKTVLRCSYMIYLARNLPDWKHIELIDDDLAA